MWATCWGERMAMSRGVGAWCLAWALSGCAGSLDNPEDFAFLLADAGGAVTVDAATATDAGAEAVPACVRDAFESCGLAGCHGAGSLQVDLVSAGLAARLVDQPALATGVCADRTLVATDGSASLLLQKLSTSNDCGSPMPLGRDVATQWEEAAYDCVEAWVISLGGSALEATP